MEKIMILGVPIDCVTMKQALERASKALEKESKFFIVTPNSEIVMLANKDKKLLDIIKRSDMTVPDGIGLVIGSKIIKKPLTERVTGIDLMENLLRYADERRKSIYLLGGKPGVAEKAAEEISKKYSDLIVSGHHHGYFKGLHTNAEGHQEEVDVLAQINAAKPDILFVALGAPKQEYFISRYMNELNATIFMGVGGSLDVYSGNVERAPMFYRNLGLEWLYRGIKEPWRFKRMSVLPQFVIQVLVRKEKPIQ